MLLDLYLHTHVHHCVALAITNGPSNITACIRSRVDIYCGFIGGNPNFITVKWVITRINSDGSINNFTIQGSNPVENYQWIPDLTNGSDSRLVVGPVDESFNHSTYQCLILLSNGTSIPSTIGNLTVIGKSIVIIV